jgi:hypothetical protein
MGVCDAVARFGIASSFLAVVDPVRSCRFRPCDVSAPHMFRAVSVPRGRSANSSDGSRTRIDAPSIAPGPAQRSADGRLREEGESRASAIHPNDAMHAHPPDADPDRMKANKRATRAGQAWRYEIRVRGPIGPTMKQAFPALGREPKRSGHPAHWLAPRPVRPLQRDPPARGTRPAAPGDLLSANRRRMTEQIT